ncbi:hypothetical protein GQ43DRAFT_436915 [Delitschia confertaspora ATCC 74209]|uniref:Uncharacterized protein n=1 Tax=Delitschia confertaspora ATCC 74209 TaxID=1513339 RepID=A0A9P4JUJ3_9PLEO|nr:hypothetical protein GQ43DRAFT_436915 [Delitschia confertaspora ATCC 74209]
MEPETIGQRPLAPKSPSHSSASIVEQVEREYTKRNMNTKTKPVSSGTDSPQTESPSVESSPSSQTAATLVDTGPKEKMPSKPSNDETSNISPGASSNHTQPQANQRTASATQPNPASPTTQESFFKSIHKRLQQLEANSTLSLQYIEEQSRILRDAFIKVEKRQLSKTETFLMNLNSTVIQELKGYRAMYEQLWQSTVLELEGMRERNQRELGELGSRLSLVADELVWQKRMAVVQSTLLLLCLGLVLFVRSGSVGAQLDVPIVQQLGSKYSHMFNTPPGSPDTGGPRRRRSGFRGMWRSDTSPSGHLSDGINYTSDAATDGARSPVQIEFSPPTPTSNPPNSDSDTGSSPPQINHNDEDSQGDGETDQGSGTAEMEDNEQGERLQVLATQSGPATPRGSRDSRPSWEDVDRAVDMLRAGEQGREREFEMELERERRRKRSPLRRMESYDAPGSDSPDNDTPDEESGVNPSVVG